MEMQPSGLAGRGTKSTGGRTDGQTDSNST